MLDEPESHHFPGQDMVLDEPESHQFPGQGMVLDEPENPWWARILSTSAQFPSQDMVLGIFPPC